MWDIYAGKLNTSTAAGGVVWKTDSTVRVVAERLVAKTRVFRGKLAHFYVVLSLLPDTWFTEAVVAPAARFKLGGHKNGYIRQTSFSSKQ